MFDNAGSMIKSVAKAFCVVGIALSLVLAMVMFGNADNKYGSSEDVYNVIGVVILVVGCFMSWVGGLLIHGFGELIEHNAKIAHNTDRLLSAYNVEDPSKTDMLPAVPFDQKENETVIPGITAEDITRKRRLDYVNKKYLSGEMSKEEFQRQKNEIMK